MVKIQVHSQGTRVRVRRGAFPMDPSLVGREGVVVHPRRYAGTGTKYGVQLDGEEQVRVFTEDELEPLGAPPDPRGGGMRGAYRGSDSPAPA